MLTDYFRLSRKLVAEQGGELALVVSQSTLPGPLGDTAVVHTNTPMSPLIAAFLVNKSTRKGFINTYYTLDKLAAIFFAATWQLSQTSGQAGQPGPPAPQRNSWEC